MGMRFAPLVGMVMLAALTAPATAQSPRQPIDPQMSPVTGPSLPQALERIESTLNYWVDDSVAGDTLFVFGAPPYRDDALVRAGRRVHYVTRDMWYQQSQGPVIRTRDLERPFCTSMYGTSYPCNLAVETPLPSSQFPVPPLPIRPALPVRTP